MLLFSLLSLPTNISVFTQNMSYFRGSPILSERRARKRKVRAAREPSFILLIRESLPKKLNFI